MPNGLTLSRDAVNAAVDAVTELLRRGFLRIYGGLQPVSPASGTNAPLLVELRFGAPAFEPAVDGVAVARAMAKAIAKETGTATWFRALGASGTDVIFDGTVGGAGADLFISNALIQRDAEVTVDRLSYRHPQGESA